MQTNRHLGGPGDATGDTTGVQSTGTGPLRQEAASGAQQGKEGVNIDGPGQSSQQPRANESPRERTCQDRPLGKGRERQALPPHSLWLLSPLPRLPTSPTKGPSSGIKVKRNISLDSVAGKGEGPTKESSQTSRRSSQHLDGRRARPRMRRAGSRPTSSRGSRRLFWEGAETSQGSREGPPGVQRRPVGGSLCLCPLFRRHSPCPESEGQGSLLWTYAQQVTEPVGCFQRPESYCLWLQLCLLENQASGHSLLLLSARGRLGGGDSTRALTLRGQICFFPGEISHNFSIPPVGDDSPA